MAQLQTLARRHCLIINIPDELPPVKADLQRVAQVLSNLVDNAAKYSPVNSTITVTASRCETAQGVQVSVSDQGVGIPAGERRNVFNAFERGEYAVRKQTVGAGLGLAICRGLIEAHGGRIWVEENSGPGTGTTVAFTLPIAE
jgi:signal transduction histidine kinase